MRVSPAVLFVVLTVTLPFIVQTRTLASFLGVKMSIAQTAMLGVVILGVIVGWAVWPDMRRYVAPTSNDR